MWSPVDTLVAVEWIIPEPGTDIPYAVVRKVSLQTPDGPVEAFRVVTWVHPRTLIREGCPVAQETWGSCGKPVYTTVGRAKSAGEQLSSHPD